MNQISSFALVRYKSAQYGEEVKISLKKRKKNQNEWKAYIRFRSTIRFEVTYLSKYGE
jgi:hypothetical protein